MSVAPDPDPDQQISDDFSEQDYLACDTDDEIPIEGKCPPWVTKLQTVVRSLPPNQAIIRAFSLEREGQDRLSCADGDSNTCATDGLHVCFPDASRGGCDIRPGYRYTWKLVTYSWLFEGGEQESTMSAIVWQSS